MNANTKSKNRSKEVGFFDNVAPILRARFEREANSCLACAMRVFWFVDLDLRVGRLGVCDGGERCVRLIDDADAGGGGGGDRDDVERGVASGLGGTSVNAAPLDGFAVGVANSGDKTLCVPLGRSSSIP